MSPRGDLEMLEEKESERRPGPWKERVPATLSGNPLREDSYPPTSSCACTSFLKSQRKPTATSTLPFFPSPTPVTLQSWQWGQRQGSGPLPAFSPSFSLLCSGPRQPGPELGVLPRDSASRTQGQGRDGPCPLGRLLPSTDIPIGWRSVRARG